MKLLLLLLLSDTLQAQSTHKYLLDDTLLVINSFYAYDKKGYLIDSATTGGIYYYFNYQKLPAEGWVYLWRNKRVYVFNNRRFVEKRKRMPVRIE